MNKQPVYAVSLNGEIDPRSCAYSRNIATATWVLINHGIYTVPCIKPDCDCIVKAVQERFPGTKCVQVTVQVAQ